MELPAALRLAIDRMLEGVPLAELQRDAARLSERYRAETRDGRLHLDDAAAVRAYLATRLPATYAAVRTSLASLAEIRPDFAPTTQIDIGAGPGTAVWAARDAFASLTAATLVETSAAARVAGQTLAGNAEGLAVTWREGDIARGLPALPPADLVTLAYVLDELSPESAREVVAGLWRLTQDMLVIVEPGTPAGWQRILAARDTLIAAGAHVVAPCPHAAPCPLAAPDWCHFAQRLARSRLHRLAKGAEVPWEDEKYSFLAVSRFPAARHPARVLAPPRDGKNRVTMKLCRPDGSVAEVLVTKRDGDAYKAARRADWGEALEGIAG
jgi:ribosomal protein RSM22 (predicted rRNA methylase)